MNQHSTSDCDCRDAFLHIDGVQYKFKSGVHRDSDRRFVGYIAQQIAQVVPTAVELIDGMLHVDYESLIPYLSESVKQNYRDIQSNKSETEQIRIVVDLLYSEFIKKEQYRATKGTSSNKGKANIKRCAPTVQGTQLRCIESTKT